MEPVETLMLIILVLITILAIDSISRKKRKRNYSSRGKKYWTKKQKCGNEHHCSYIRKKYLTVTEINFAKSIQKALPKPYRLYPQICLASVIEKVSEDIYQNELYRIIDFGVFDSDYNVVMLIEINDKTHHQTDRQERDKKVKEICKMADIPLITFWTEYGINDEYIQKRISEYI